MPRIKSAIKRVEVAERNRERNRSWKSSIRTVRNQVDEALTGKQGGNIEDAIKKAFSTIDRAVTKGVLHRNTGARRKARLIKLLKRKSGV